MLVVTRYQVYSHRISTRLNPKGSEGQRSEVEHHSYLSLGADFSYVNSNTPTYKQLVWLATHWPQNNPRLLALKLNVLCVCFAGKGTVYINKPVNGAFTYKILDLNMSNNKAIYYIPTCWFVSWFLLLHLSKPVQLKKLLFNTDVCDSKLIKQPRLFTIFVLSCLLFQTETLTQL